MVKGKLLLHRKLVDEDESIIEMKIWEVPLTNHHPNGLKYSLVYIVDEQRVLGFDNHERKGDHVHIGDQVKPYSFKSIDQLLEDFQENIRFYKEGQNES